MNLGLAARLRQETAELHRRAEQAGMMREMLHGRIEAGAYVSLLRNLFGVYQALESSLRMRAGHAALATLPTAVLARAPSLAADLASLHGPDWELEVPELPAGRAYGRRIRAVAAQSPELLAAHAYVRYLGDVSGGQALGGLVAGALGLETDAGLSFYRFPAVPDLAEFKREFRRALDTLPLDRPGQDRIVEEAREAFRLNIELFEAVAVLPSPSLGPPKRIGSPLRGQN